MKESVKRFLKQVWVGFCVESTIVALFFLILNRISPLSLSFVRRMEYGVTLSLVTAVTCTTVFWCPCRTWAALWLRRALFLLAAWVEINLIAYLYFPTVFLVDRIICTCIALIVIGGGTYGVCDLVWRQRLKKINAKLEENGEEP